jgi:hypothetical protein
VSRISTIAAGNPRLCGNIRHDTVDSRKHIPPLLAVLGLSRLHLPLEKQVAHALIGRPSELFTKYERFSSRASSAFLLLALDLHTYPYIINRSGLNVETLRKMSSSSENEVDASHSESYGFC